MVISARDPKPTILCRLRTPSTAQSLTFPRSGSSSPTAMIDLLYALLATASSSLKSQPELALQNLARGRRDGVAKEATKKPSGSSPIGWRSAGTLRKAGRPRPLRRGSCDRSKMRSCNS